MRPITEPPSRVDKALFCPEFGQRFVLTVDTEEEYDWAGPFRRQGHSLDHLPRLAKFQQFCEHEGVCPVYLLDYPVATSALAADILREPVMQGRAEIGLQLHPWVNPPHDEEINSFNSFAGNLPEQLERAKFQRLRLAIERNFESVPHIYRAARYGVGPHTGDILRDNGIAMDSSVRPNFDYSASGGTDFRNHPQSPYWLNDEKSLLELPLTTVYWGMLRRQGNWLHPLANRVPPLGKFMARAGLLERIPLTPEGTTVEMAIRGIDIALDDGSPCSFSVSTAPRCNPATRPMSATTTTSTGSTTGGGAFSPISPCAMWRPQRCAKSWPAWKFDVCGKGRVRHRLSCAPLPANGGAHRPQTGACSSVG